MRLSSDAKYNEGVYVNEVWQAVIPGAAALVGAVIGSIGMPWAKWMIETRRVRLKSRRELLMAVRAAMAAKPDKHDFREHPLYAQLRPHLSEGLRHDIESDSIQVQRGGRGRGANQYHARLLDEVSTLESKWKLL